MVRQMTVTKCGKLDRLFAPSSIGIVGASTNPTRIGSRVLSNLRRHGYAGDVFVINSRYPEVNGVKCYPSLTSLDEVPDVALLAVDADASLDVLTEYAELGGRNAVLLASGFESGEEGMRRSERLKELARDHGLNVAGPNSQGLWSVGHKMVLAFGSEADRDEVRLGAVAVIAQSGSLGGAVTRRLLDLQVGVSYFISTGDGTVTDTADYLSQVIEDAQVRVVALYLEGTRDGRRLGQAIRAAHQRGVRVVVLPGGMSAAGRSATSSHTGRIITRPRLLTQLLEQDGVIVARTVRELVAVTRTLALSPLELPRAPKVAVLGISGGMLALLVDACEGRLDLADFSDATLGRLRATLPDYTSPKNPVDVTGAVVENEALLVDSVAAVIDDSDVDAVIAGLDNRGYDRLIRNADRFISTARAADKPMVFSLWDTPTDRDLDVERRLNCGGVFIADDPSEAVAPLTWLTRNPREAPPHVQLSPLKAFDSIEELKTWRGIGRLAEALEAKLPQTWVLDAADAVPAAELTNPPYVVKPVPNAVAHKSDRGLVHLNLLTDDDVRAAVKHVRTELGPKTPVLVQELVTGVEVLVTVGHDPDWGPILTLGSGGKFVELMNDVSHVALPCDAVSMRNALARLGIHQLLKGYRDIPPADVDALVGVLDRLQRILITHSDTVDEIELNPVVVGAKSQGLFIIDLLVRDRAR